MPARRKAAAVAAAGLAPLALTALAAGPAAAHGSTIGPVSRVARAAVRVGAQTGGGRRPRPLRRPHDSGA
ncbi:hypothetical protein OG802_07340 [Streptomyces sp. NBC_00704]|uniref:hypothetical protein n=1 Tax=Streptomyces sp. NBC_00704 TaxID=2975809 RepID=UPI002E33D4D5|nr:hypothetical protein [Streptomyces sp. NBC_00704]